MHYVITNDKMFCFLNLNTMCDYKSIISPGVEFISSYLREIYDGGVEIGSTSMIPNTLIKLLTANGYS